MPKKLLPVRFVTGTKLNSDVKAKRFGLELGA